MNAAHSTQTSLFVSFRLEDQLYGLPIEVVKEVNPTTAICRVPLSKNSIRGVVNIRGQIVLVMDIVVIFGRQERPVGPESQMVILKTDQELGLIRNVKTGLFSGKLGDKPVAFLVDSIGEVVTVPDHSIEAPPPHLSTANMPYIRGVARNGDDLLVVLDGAALIAAA